MDHSPLILGSRSPRREEIMRFFSLPFEQIPSLFDEESLPFEGDPIAYTNALAKGKALELAKRFPKRTILCADTIVYHKGRPLLKPKDESEGLEMLRSLLGSKHTVYTSVSLYSPTAHVTECAQTDVFFHTLSEEELIAYHKAFHGLDKAGGYGIQEGGSLIVKKIEGCFYNVMGLPLSLVWKLLKTVKVDLCDYLS